LKNKLYININYISNFNPNFFKNFNNFKNKNKKKIICRNFFLFLFLLNFLKNFLACNSLKIFVKPKKKNFINVLKAPYKNKLSKHQIGFSRYFLIFKLVVMVNVYIFNNFSQFFLFLNKFIYFLKFFETNLVYNYKLIFKLKFKLNNYFNFKKLN
jgi:hypothetical protein